MKVNCHSETIAKRRKVKSSEKEIANFYEKGKDYLSVLEIKVLLEASKKQDTQKGNTKHTISL
jgi:hypothetical protein